MQIVTSAISGEPTHTKLWENILSLRDILDAELIVIGNYAENQNLANQASDEVFWQPICPDIEPYVLRDERRDLGNAVVRSDWNIRPKTLNPLTIARGASKDGGGHQIFGHPQISVESQPRALNGKPKSLYTTGTLTVQDCSYYRRSQSERAAQFHHTYGFLVVCGAHVFPVAADQQGSFTFFNYTFGEALPHNWAVLGDLHFPNQDDQILEQATDLLGGLEVKDLILHDTLDFQYGSHHQYSYRTKHKAAYLESVTAELDWVGEMIKNRLGEFNLHITQSNHDLHLDKWLSQDASQIHHSDLELYFHLNHQLLTQDKLAFELSMGHLLPSVNWYDDRRPLKTLDIIHLHGDRGNAGSKGTPNQFAKASSKICAGHTHTESILKGYYNPGCLKKLPSTYEAGLTTATQGIVLISGNGKRQLVTARDGVLIPTEIIEALG